MAAAYSFTSEWRVSASADRCWAELERMLVAADTAWWPGMSVPDPPSRLAPGERLSLAVRSPLGYRLRVRLLLTGVVEGRSLEAASTGDLVGAGGILLEPDAARTIIVLRWDVTTARPWMNATAPLLRPLFAAAHTRVMARGERGLRARLDA